MLAVAASAVLAIAAGLWLIANRAEKRADLAARPGPNEESRLADPAGPSDASLTTPSPEERTTPRDEVPSPTTTPSGADPSAAPAPDRARWRARIEKRLAKYESNPTNLDALHELARECILARLDLANDYTVPEPGAESPLVANDEIRTVTRDSPGGSRVYQIRRAHYPAYWDVLGALTERQPKPGVDAPTTSRESLGLEVRLLVDAVLAELADK